MKKLKINTLSSLPTVYCSHCYTKQHTKDINKRKQCKSCKKMFAPKTPIECSHCKKQEAFRIASYTLENGGFKKTYKCINCNEKTNIVIPPRPEITNKEIESMDKLTIVYKLSVWREGYLKRRVEPKKYEPMLYFLDLYNGFGL